MIVIEVQRQPIIVMKTRHGEAEAVEITTTRTIDSKIIRAVTNVAVVVVAVGETREVVEVDEVELKMLLLVRIKRVDEAVASVVGVAATVMTIKGKSLIETMPTLQRIHSRRLTMMTIPKMTTVVRQQQLQEIIVTTIIQGEVVVAAVVVREVVVVAEVAAAAREEVEVAVVAEGVAGIIATLTTKGIWQTRSMEFERLLATLERRIFNA